MIQNQAHSSLNKKNPKNPHSSTSLTYIYNKNPNTIAPLTTHFINQILPSNSKTQTPTHKQKTLPKPIRKNISKMQATRKKLQKKRENERKRGESDR